MILLKIAFNSFATAVFAMIFAGCLSFVYAIVSKPNQAGVGAGIGEAVGAGIVAGLAGLILGIAGTLLFPASYLKLLGIAVLLFTGMMLLGWRMLSRLA